MIKLIWQILKGYFYLILYYLYKPYRKKIKKEASRRIKICESCEYFYKPLRNCSICGCLMDVKVLSIFEFDNEGISIDGCLKRKW